MSSYVVTQRWPKGSPGEIGLKALLPGRLEQVLFYPEGALESPVLVTGIVSNRFFAVDVPMFAFDRLRLSIPVSTDERVLLRLSPPPTVDVLTVFHFAHGDNQAWPA